MSRTPSPKRTPRPVSDTVPDQGKTRPDVRPLIGVAASDFGVLVAVRERPDDAPRALHVLVAAVAEAAQVYADARGVAVLRGTFDGPIGWPATAEPVDELVVIQLVDGVPAYRRRSTPPGLGVGDPLADAYVELVVAVESAAQWYADQVAGGRLRRFVDKPPPSDKATSSAAADVRPLIAVRRSGRILYLATRDVTAPDMRPVAALMRRVGNAVADYYEALGLRLVADTIGDDGRWPDRLGTGRDVVALNLVDGVPMAFRFPATPDLSDPSAAAAEQRAYDELNDSVAEAVRQAAQQVAAEWAGDRMLVTAARTADRLHFHTRRLDPDTAPGLAWMTGFVTGALIDYADALGIGYDGDPVAARAAPRLLSVAVADGGLPTVRFGERPRSSDLPPLTAAQADRAYDQLVERVTRHVDDYRRKVGVQPLAWLALVDGVAVLRVERPAYADGAARDVLVDQFVDLLRPLAAQLGVRLAVGVADA